LSAEALAKDECRVRGADKIRVSYPAKCNLQNASIFDLVNHFNLFNTYFLLKSAG
jgi:hypothetical protein